jgi:hypothetical protein
MSPTLLSLIIFACLFGGALIGMAIRPRLPESHLTAESREMVKLGTGLVATMSALVLGLLVASAKSSYDAQKDGLTELASKLIMLDRTLAHYGPETMPVRLGLRQVVLHGIGQVWNEGLGIGPGDATAEVLYDRIQQLTPQTDGQRAILAQAVDLMRTIAQARWLMYAQRSSSISFPLLVTVVFWLTINFVSFGLLTPRNATVVVTLFVCALSVSGAIFLILEMDRPFGGIISISSAPLREVAEHLAR